MADKKISKKKIFKIGAYSIALSAIALAIVIALNLLVAQLPASLIHIDATPEKVLTVGDETKEIIDSLDTDVTLYHIVTPGNEDMYIKEMLERYEEAGEHIKVETVDPVSRPSFTTEYTSQNLSDNSIIAVSDKRNTVISTDDIYMYEISGYEGQYLTYSKYQSVQNQYAMYGMSAPGANEYFFAENALTRAVDYVTRTELPVMYSLSGHGETSMTQSDFSNICVEENFELRDLALQSGDEVKVPDDASSIVINTPTADISEAEADALKSYLNDGGKIILTTSYRAYSAENMPNLSGLCKYMGLTAIEKPIVESDKEHYYGYIDNIISNITGSGITSLMQSLNYYFYMPGSHAITTAETDANVETYALLTTSESAYAYDNDSKDNADEAVKMQYTLGYQSVLTDESGTKGGSLIWLGSAYAFDSGYANGTGNSLLFTAILQDSGESSSAISLIGKNISEGSLSTTEQTAYVWIAAACTVVPIAVVAAGLIIWVRRRKR